MSRRSKGSWYYEQLELGFNYRMTDIHAALGLSQLDRLEEFVIRRNDLAQRYDSALVNIPVQLQIIPKDVYSARHLYVVRVNAKQHRSLFEAFRSEGVGVNLHYIPVHLQPYFRNLGFKEGLFQESEDYGQEAISLPLYPDLSHEEQDKVIEVLTRELNKDR
jgi:dTDP-4-amino-4,6-dideoxygalactose transaminase